MPDIDPEVRARLQDAFAASEIAIRESMNRTATLAAWCASQAHLTILIRADGLHVDDVIRIPDTDTFVVVKDVTIVEQAAGPVSVIATTSDGVIDLEPFEVVECHRPDRSVQ